MMEKPGAALGECTDANDANGSPSDGQEAIMVVFSDDRQRFTFAVEDLTKKSEYFRALLESGMIESSKHEVSLPCVSSQSLRQVQKYLTLRTAFKDDLSSSHPAIAEFEDFIHTTVYLQMSELLRVYESSLEERLEVDNFFEVRALAETFSLTRLKGFIETYLADNISKIWCHETFLQEYDTIESLASLLERDDLNFQLGEVEACMIIGEFVQSKDIAKLDIGNLPRLMNSVRFPLIDKQNCDLTLFSNFIEDNKGKIPSDIVTSLEAIHKRALSFQVKQNKRFVLSPQDAWGKLRCSQPVVFGCGGFTQSESSTRKVQFLSTQHLEGSCQRRTELEFDVPIKRLDKSLRLPTPLVEHAVCVLNGYLYVAGGQHKYCSDGRYTSNRCYRLDPLCNAWTKISSMNSARSLFYLGSLSGCLYATCGWTGPNSVTKSVECYDVISDVWREVARVPMGLHEHAGCSHQGKLYVSGGYRGPFRGHLNQVWSYDASANVWQEKSPMTHRRSYHAMASVGNNIFVAGGVNYIGNDAFEDVLIMELYDPAVDQWSDLVQRLPRPASCMSSLVVGTRLLLFGGHSFEDDTDHKMLQVWDTETSSFKECLISSNRIQYFPVALISVKLDNTEKHSAKTAPSTAEENL